MQIGYGQKKVTQNPMPVYLKNFKHKHGVDVLPELSEDVLAGSGDLDPHVHKSVAAPAHKAVTKLG
jgi:hypothetical protein